MLKAKLSRKQNNTHLSGSMGGHSNVAPRISFNREASLHSCPEQQHAWKHVGCAGCLWPWMVPAQAQPSIWGWGVDAENAEWGVKKLPNSARPYATPLSLAWGTQAPSFKPQNVDSKSQAVWMIWRACSTHTLSLTLIQKGSNGRFIIFKGYWAYAHKRPTSSLFHKSSVATQLISLDKIRKKKREIPE